MCIDSLVLFFKIPHIRDIYDAEAEAPKFWPPDVKTQLIRKDPDAGKD